MVWVLYGLLYLSCIYRISIVYLTYIYRISNVYLSCIYRISIVFATYFQAERHGEMCEFQYDILMLYLDTVAMVTVREPNPSQLIM